MNWDIRSLQEIFREGLDLDAILPEGHLVIASRKMVAWTGELPYQGSRISIPAGKVMLVTATYFGSYNNKLIQMVCDEQVLVADRFTDLVLCKPENKLQNQSFAITGWNPKDREFYKTIIKAKGGIWKNQVSNQTDVLIAGTSLTVKKTTKYRKALRLGKTIIDEKELLRLLRS